MDGLFLKTHSSLGSTNCCNHIWGMSCGWVVCVGGVGHLLYLNNFVMHFFKNKLQLINQRHVSCLSVLLLCWRHAFWTPQYSTSFPWWCPHREVFSALRSRYPFDGPCNVLFVLLAAIKVCTYTTCCVLVPVASRTFQPFVVTPFS